MLFRRRISTRRAKSIRRGIISGRLLADQLLAMHKHQPASVYQFWAGAKIDAYSRETESYIELEALYYSAMSRLNGRPVPRLEELYLYAPMPKW